MLKLDFNLFDKFNFVKTQEYSHSYKHGYWAFSLLFDKKNYYDSFKKKFHKNGGDFFYACWRLPYQEEFFKELKIKYKKCEKAEKIQIKEIISTFLSWFSTCSRYS